MLQKIKNNVLIIALCMCVLMAFTSCVTTARAYDYDYHPYNEAENVVVVGDVCYVYYTQPTTLFLNTLHIIDGAYYYWHSSHYIPVIFPNWRDWSPHRFYYYDTNRWCWRDRYHGYNHIEYRNSHKWNDYRKSTPHKNSERIVRPNSGNRIKPQHNEIIGQKRSTNHGFSTSHISRPSSTRMPPTRGSFRGSSPSIGHRSGGRR